jgi:hypothetical protein
MKNLKTFFEFINEAKLPYSIEKVMQSADLNWSEDKKGSKDLIDEHGKDTTHAHVYQAKDSNRDVKYTVKTWMNDLQYWLQLEIDGIVDFVQDYQQTEKRYYDQDCESILGFQIKN